MALSGGHWDTLAELKKTTVSTLVPGSVEEDVKNGNPLELLPLVQANHTGKSIKWLRESVTAEDDVATIGRGGQTGITESITYTEKERELRTRYLYRKLDKFTPGIYDNVNEYEEMVLDEMMRSIKKALGDGLIYDDYTYDSNSLQMDGLHAIAAESYGENWDIDMGETALSLKTWRNLYDEMKHGVDFWLAPYEIAAWVDAAFQYKGLAGLATATAGTMGMISWGVNQVGEPVTYFAGKPIIRSHFLVAEQANTGLGSDARAKYSSGTRMYSIFGIKLGTGSLKQADPGLKLAFGMTEQDGQFFNLEYFDKHPDYIAKAFRLSSNTNLLAGSAMCVGRIFDITNAAVTV